METARSSPWGHRQELLYDGQCVGEALVEIGRLQEQRLIRRCSEGPASLEERDVCWRSEEGGQGKWLSPGLAQLGLGHCHGGFEMSLLSGVSVSGRNGHPYTPT